SCSSDGICRHLCQDDCDPGEWCAPTLGGFSACRQFQRYGGRCGAFTRADDAQQCPADGFCEPRSLLRADLGGLCRRSCQDASDCPANQYCAFSVLGRTADDGGLGVCRRDGRCLTPADCDQPGNDFIRPACVGATTCEQRVCGVDCDVSPVGP